MSGHALYRTIAAILALISLGALPMLASLAVLPVRLAFLEWSRKSELSADRAGLLGGQDVVVAQRLDMKMAGGGRGEAFAGQLNVDAFMQQAHEYAASRRRARRGLQDAQHPGADPPDAHGARRRAAALGHRAATTTGSCAASTCGAAPRRPTGPSGTTSRPRAATTPGGEGDRHPGRRRRAAGRRARPRRVQERAEAVRLLVVGAGGREHALCWALRRENPEADIYCAPGNPGTAELGDEPLHRRRRPRPAGRCRRHARHRSHRDRARGAAGARAGRPASGRGARGVRARARRRRSSRPRRRSPRK